MKHNNIGFLLREGARAMFKHGFMSFAAICITVACLVIMASFGLIAYDLNLSVEDAQAQNRVRVAIDETYTEAEAKSVWSQVNQISNVENVEFVTRQQAYDDFVKDYDASIFQGVDASMMRDQLVITLIDNDEIYETVEELKAVPGVAEVYANPEFATALATVRNVLYVATLAIAGVLVIVSLIIISNTVRLAMMDRREEIAIMKMVGANNSFIRLPFLVEGFFLGILGGAFAFFIEWGLYETMRGAISGTNIDFFTIVPFDQLWLPVAAVCCVVGLVIGIFGGLMSIRRFLKV